LPKILAVDDSATMRRIYEMTFAGQSGYEVVTANGGEQALRSAGGIDLVLVDASMSPSGYDVARSLRDGGFVAPILILASQHAPYDVERARAAGIDDHLLKPFDTQSLLDKSRDILQRGRSDGARSDGARGASPVAAAAPSASRTAVPTPTILTPAVAVPSVPASSPAPARASFAKPTAAYGAPPAKAPAVVPPFAVVGASGAVPRPAPSAGLPADAAGVSAGAVGEMAGKLSQMGLTPAQVDGILALSREVIERVVWEVVPEVAERLVREEIKRLTA
jgi:CheY-like chemotaxis protein